MTDQYVNVYRVEKRGRGPFKNYADAMSRYLPCPRGDSGLMIWNPEEIAKYRFGAPSAESLKEWIKLPHKLHSAGFKVSLYKVKKNYVHSSEIQSMFIKRHAKKVLEWDVETFCRDI